MCFIEGEEGFFNGADFVVPAHVQQHYDLEAVTGSDEESFDSWH